MENYEIWDHHGERRIEAGNMEGCGGGEDDDYGERWTNASEVREDDDAHLVMMHDGTGDDVVAMVVAKAVVGMIMVKTTKKMKMKTSWMTCCTT